jgi:hypothetical protein
VTGKEDKNSGKEFWLEWANSRSLVEEVRLKLRRGSKEESKE